VIGGPHKGRKFDFVGHENFIVGRAPCAHFRLPKEDPYFSRFHFMVEINPPRCRLVDLVSLNGTYVNGQQVEVTDLHDGDEIRGGDTLLRVSLVGLGGVALVLAQPEGGRGVDSTRAVPPAAAREAGEMPADEEPAIQPPIPGFEILRELGRGGMGMVYLVQRTADKVQLALKTIRPGFAASEREVQRFLRECQILCTLRHPHIVAFHQMGRIGELFYFVMDYVPGTDAARLVERDGRLPLTRAVRLVCQILTALDYAHRRGFVHRDVKPANLLVSREEGQEVCRLADFGLARVYHESQMSGLTVLGDVGGTLPYMAPEQITDYRDARPSADQYSAAATLYYLLTGRFLYDFDEDRTEQRLMRILTQSPVPIHNRRPEIPERLAWVIHQALAKEPGHRFPDAAALREALLPFCRGS
jgi:serine/threonine-protein kinase